MCVWWFSKKFYIQICSTQICFEPEILQNLNFFWSKFLLGLNIFGTINFFGPKFRKQLNTNLFGPRIVFWQHFFLSFFKPKVFPNSIYIGEHEILSFKLDPKTFGNQIFGTKKKFPDTKFSKQKFSKLKFYWTKNWFLTPIFF